jgi:hypothetical protein
MRLHLVQQAEKRIDGVAAPLAAACETSGFTIIGEDYTRAR